MQGAGARAARARRTEGASWERDAELARDDFLWALGSLAQLHRLPFDPKLVLQQFAPPYTPPDLIRAAEGLGLEVEIRRTDLGRVDDHDLPCVAVLAGPPPGEGETDAPDPATGPDAGETTGESGPRLALIARRDDDRVLWFEAGSDTPRTDALDDLAPRLEPAVLVARRAAEPAPAEPGEAPREFGFRWFIPELLRYKGIWRDVLLASLAIQVLALATPLFTQVVIDKVIVHHTMNTLIVIAVGLFAFMIFSGVMTWVRQYLVLHTGNRVDAVLGNRVLSHLFDLPMRYFEHRPTGTLVARVQATETVREFISGAAVTLLLDLPFLFVFLAVMFYYSWRLTLIVIAILTLIAIISLAVAPTLRRRLNEQFQLGARNQAFVTEYVNGVETVKSLQMEPQVKDRYGDYLSSYLGATFNARRLFNTYNVTASTLEQIQVLAVLGVGAWLVMTTDGFTVGMLVAFQMFASRLAQPVLRLVGLWQEFQQASIAVKRLGDIMNAPPEPYALVPARARGGEGRIEVQGLSFRYRDELPDLYRDLDLTIPAGSCIAVMGPSGSGKSTLAKLLQGFYRPSGGRILIDARDIRHLAANELRRYFGVVPQETMLFSGSVYDNLIAANPHATFEQVLAACRMAEIHETIEQLPQGYQTGIGEHGAGLSGGQKQRLAIARALLKRPRILIFDEATSHLDAATADHLAETVNGLKGKVTILFIAHQLPKGLKVDDAVILSQRTSEADAGESREKRQGEDET